MCYHIVSVPRSILRDHYDEIIEEDEGNESEYEVEGYESVDNALRESHIYSESPKMAVAKEQQNKSILSNSPNLPHPTQTSQEAEEFQSKF